MIVVERRFEEMIDLLPYLVNPNVSTDLEFKPKYSFGDDKELMQYIILNKSDVYPLVWLVTPIVEVHTKKKVQMDSVSFILAVKSASDLLNKQRFKTTYKNVLLPLYDNFLELFQKANICNLDEKITIVKFPNYSNEKLPGNRESLKSSEKHKTFDIWDAIKITLKVSVNDNCLKEVKFTSNNNYMFETLSCERNGWIWIEDCYVKKLATNLNKKLIQKGDIVYHKEVISNGENVSLVGWEYNSGNKLLIESYKKVKSLA